MTHKVIGVDANDNLANDLLHILAKQAADGEGTIYAANIKDLLADLSIYIVNRDHKILQHGIELGKEKALQDKSNDL